MIKLMLINTTENYVHIYEGLQLAWTPAVK